MFQLDFGDHRPLWEQIKEKIKELILSGALKENEKIPSVRELASILAINPNTIQKSYKDLENEGYIYSKRASGSYVAPKEYHAPKIDYSELFQKLDSLLLEMSFCGVEYENIITHAEKIFNRKD